MRRTLLCLLLLLACAPAQAALRCGNGLVSEGDHAYEVLQLCGEPDLRELAGGPYLPGVGVVADEQRWYYNRGPYEFLQVVEIRNSRVVSIEPAGYGFNEHVRGRCTSGALHRGMSRLELLARCGEPAYRSTRLQLLPPPLGGRYPQTAVPVEEWVYELGRGRFTRIVVLEGGVVQDIELGPRQ